MFPKHAGAKYACLAGIIICCVPWIFYFAEFNLFSILWGSKNIKVHQNRKTVTINGSLPQSLLWILFRQHKIEELQENVSPDSLLPPLQLVEKCEPETIGYGMRPWIALGSTSITSLRKKVICDFFIVSGNQWRLQNDDKEKHGWKKTSRSAGDPRSHGRWWNPWWWKCYFETTVVKPGCTLELPVEF